MSQAIPVKVDVVLMPAEIPLATPLPTFQIQATFRLAGLSVMSSVVGTSAQPHVIDLFRYVSQPDNPGYSQRTMDIAENFLQVTHGNPFSWAFLVDDLVTQVETFERHAKNLMLQLEPATYNSLVFRDHIATIDHWSKALPAKMKARQEELFSRIGKVATS